MSKLSDKYKIKKEEDSAKVYIFKSGIFYIALNEDAKLLNEKLGLNITDFGLEFIKCGFPANSLGKYETLLKEKEIKYEVVENVKEETVDILKDIKKLDLNNITPIEAYQKLLYYKNILKNK